MSSPIRNIKRVAWYVERKQVNATIFDGTRATYYHPKFYWYSNNSCAIIFLLGDETVSTGKWKVTDCEPSCSNSLNWGKTIIAEKVPAFNGRSYNALPLAA